jgi:hypothetical protein
MWGACERVCLLASRERRHRLLQLSLGSHTRKAQAMPGVYRWLMLFCLWLSAASKEVKEAPTLSPAELAHKRKFFSIGEGFEGSASDWTEYIVWVLGVTGVFFYSACASSEPFTQYPGIPSTYLIPVAARSGEPECATKLACHGL